VLDAFEGTAYDRRWVGLADGSEAWAYAWRDRSDVSPDDWSPEVFAREQLASYVTRL